MLRPEDIRQKRFERGSFGYNPEEVDMFISRVADDYEALFNSSADSEEKIIKLVEKINEYRADEDVIKDALLSAQKEAKRIVTEANAKSEKMMTEAAAKTEEIKAQSEIECERIIAEHKEYCAKVISENTAETEKKIRDVREEYATRSAQLKELKRTIAEFKSRLTDIYSQQIQLVMEMPDDCDDETASDTVEVNTAEAAAPVEEKADVEPVIPDENTGNVQTSQQTADIPALKDESVFESRKPREVKFSDLRFGNKN